MSGWHLVVSLHVGFFFLQDWHQKEKKLNETVEVLQSQVYQLKEENQELLTRLQCTHSKEGKMTGDAHNNFK